MTAGLPGAVAVITGGTGGMGRFLVRGLVDAGVHVVVTARDPDKVQQLRQEVGGNPDQIEVVLADLSCRDGVRLAAREITARHDRLDILINNAGAHYRQHLLNADGIEMHLAVDHLAGFALTQYLLGALRASEQARIVNVVSDSMNDTRLLKLRRRPRPVELTLDRLTDLSLVNPAEDFVAFQAYARAKLLTVMCGYLLAEELRDTAITVNAVHPGLIGTAIVNDILPAVLSPLAGVVKKTMLTPAEGATAVLHAATDPARRSVTGRYYLRDRESRSPAVSYDVGLQRASWQLSQSYLAG